MSEAARRAAEKILGSPVERDHGEPRIGSASDWDHFGGVPSGEQTGSRQEQVAAIIDAEFASIVAENKRWKSACLQCPWCSANFDDRGAVKVHIESCERHPLRQQVAELQRDANRYRWLVSNVDPAIPDTLGRHIIYIPPLLSEHGTIDAAIDAALQEPSRDA